MALPTPVTSEIFSSDQTVAFRASYWDTTSTAIRIGEGWSVSERLTAYGAGLDFAMFDLLTSSFAPTTKAEIETALAPTSGQTKAVLGYTGSAYRTGVTPLIYSYWGAGTPTGGSRSKQALMKYSGYVREACTATLVFAGQGNVAAYVTRASNGTVEEIVRGATKEPDPAAAQITGVNAAVVTGTWGYRYGTKTFAKGDKIDVYYWHNGEPWGGIACKVFRGTLLPNSDFLKNVREAPVLGTSFMSKEVAYIPATTVPYVRRAEVRTGINTVSELRLQVAVTRQGDGRGYYFSKVGEDSRLVDTANATTIIKKGRMLHFEGGFKVPTGGEEMYPRFTGIIEDITLDGDGEFATVNCRGIESKLTDVADENNPDRLAYHAFGYILRERSSEPVFGVPAYDNWPLEVAVANLAYKAGIDSFNLGMTPLVATPVHGRYRYKEYTSRAVFNGAQMFAARALGTPTKMISLERQSNYGNVAPFKKDYLPNDDEYLFSPDVNQRVYDRAISLADHYGYDFGTNAEGQFLLGGRNNPMYFQYATKRGSYNTTLTEGADQKVVVPAVGGITLARKHSEGTTWSRTVEGRFSRVDLYAGVGVNADGLNGGKLSVVVEVRSGATWAPYFSGTLDTSSLVPEAYYYDDVVRTNGTNVAVLTLGSVPLDYYRVTIGPGGPASAVAPAATDCWYRINGFAIYERDPEQAYPTALGQVARPFSTLRNIIQLDTESNFKDLRNHVVVVGSRKATVTDSEKIGQGETSNTEYEFHVAVAADPYSIYDPESANFVGAKRMAVVYDSKVSDSDFARWLSRSILYRYRMPKASARFTHTAIPCLELRDAMFVVEERNRSVDHVLRVTEFTESWSDEGATVQIEGAANAEIPSYQPREDIDIDTLFVDPADGLGEPILNLSIGYKNIFGVNVGNADLTNAAAIKGFYTKAANSFAPMFSQAITDANSIALTYPAIPETMYLAMNISHTSNTAPVKVQARGYSLDRKRVLVNNPYRHFFNVASWSAAKLPTVNFTFQEGDGSSLVYSKTYYNFPTGAATTDTPMDTGLANDQWYILYDHLKARTGNNPFYDPYTSEIGNFVSINFDLLVSGRVRVSVWDANHASGYETPVAWLTSPENDPEEPEQHWAYMEAGRGKSLVWDGVDNIGFWNTLQSTEFAESMNGAFGDKAMAVSRGFYAWNDKTTNLHTLIGDTATQNFDKNNAPYFTIGQYGQFYLKVEVLNDDLVRKDLASQGNGEPRTVNSHTLPKPGEWNTHTETYVWTHLGEPTQVAIRIQDWIDAGSWTPGMVTTSGQWSAFSTPGASDGSFRVGRPVKMTFVPQPRRGVLWEKADRSLDVNKTSVKLTRQAHLKATVFDQHWRMSGKPWQDFHEDYDVGASEQRRLANRMYHNEDHTLEWEDEAWRTGENLSSYEWIFDPSMFKKDWGNGQTESLRYCDFEQLETLPGYDSKKLGGTSISERAYMVMAYMSYLFYMSAQTLDRSGRRQHCLNSWTDSSGVKQGHIDKSKIVSTTWRAATAATAPYAVVAYEERGAATYLPRTIFVRQWREAYWISATDSRSPVNKYGITNAHQLKFVQPVVSNFLYRRKFFVDATNAFDDRWVLAYQTAKTRVNRIMHDNSAYNSTSNNWKRTLEGGDTDVWVKPVAFGSWTFDRPSVEGWFSPSPVRDFQPYWKFPYMPDAAVTGTHFYTRDLQTNALDVLSCASSQSKFSLRDPAAKDIWYGYAFSEAFALAKFNAYTTSDPENKYYHYGARLERTVEEQGSEKDGLDDVEIPHIFDYSREDNLDRFDQYRGVISRAPYANRQVDETENYRDNDKARAASALPVRPAGTYLFNLARYNLYTQAPVHEDVPSLRIHFVDAVDDWFDMRFRHEYVWYSERYFPVTAKGGSLYGYTKNEYTKALSWVGAPWWTKGAGGSGVDKLHYDPGAWTGWKDDVWTGTLPTHVNSTQFSTWTTSASLRWQEIGTTSRNAVAGNTFDNAFGMGASGPGGTPSYRFWIHQPTMGERARVTRQNIFDEHYAEMKGARLAVGPEVPESRTLVMNLTLPERLRS